MSDQQCVFDNWQEEAEKITKEESSTSDPNKNNQSKTNDQTQQQKQNQNKKQKSQIKPQQAKLTLKQKVQQYKKMTPQIYQARLNELNNKQKEGKQEQIKQGQVEGENKSKKISLGAVKLLKSVEDFTNFAEQIAEILTAGLKKDQTLNQQSITVFFQQILLYMYDGLNWENFNEIQKKLKVIKNQRKNEQKRQQKQATRNKNKKEDPKQSGQSSKIAQKQLKDDIFGGVAMMSSKQQQDERKKKAAQKKAAQKNKQQKMEENEQKKQEVKQTPPPVDDDDDFM